MSAAYLVDGRGPVYAPAIGRPAGVLHRAVTHSSPIVPYAGCGNAGRLDEDGLLFTDEADKTRLCRAAGCAGVPWNRGRGARLRKVGP